MKDYTFIAKTSEQAKGYVEAENIEDAKRKILKGQYDDIVDTYDMKICEVVDIKEC